MKARLKVRLVDQKVNRPINASQGSKMNGEESIFDIGQCIYSEGFYDEPEQLV